MCCSHRLSAHADVTKHRTARTVTPVQMHVKYMACQSSSHNYSFQRSTCTVNGYYRISSRLREINARWSMNESKTTCVLAGQSQRRYKVNNYCNLSLQSTANRNSHKDNFHFWHNMSHLQKMSLADKSKMLLFLLQLLMFTQNCKQDSE